MSPDQTRKRLLVVADTLGGVHRLIDAAEMATDRLDEDEKAALSELLLAIDYRLLNTVEDLHRITEEAA